MSAPRDYCEMGEYWPKERGPEMMALVEECVPLKFYDLMTARILVSRQKYGKSEDAYPERMKAVDNVQVRLNLYLHGDPSKNIPPGNVEYLVDAANFCMLEFMHPSREDAFFRATDSDGSPGLLTRAGEYQHGRHEA